MLNDKKITTEEYEDYIERVTFNTSHLFGMLKRF